MKKREKSKKGLEMTMHNSKKGNLEKPGDPASPWESYTPSVYRKGFLVIGEKRKGWW